jgi:heat shock protein HtpX
MLKWPRRIILFVLTNVLVVITLNIILNLLGVRPYLAERGIDYSSLLIFCVIWGFGGAFISLALSRFMAKTFMGVQVIKPESPGGAAERWLVDTVHRLARNAGLTTMPEVGIYESRDPNAFATGPTRDSSLVAVSTGLFEGMEKDEIEGVLGHEITHVANGDMVTMTLLQGVINAFVMFFARIVAFLVTQGRRGDDDRGGSYGMQFMLTMVLEMAFGILGMIPLMAFSRWREFRADAGGAKLAGRAKMISALQALGSLKHRPSPDEPASVATLKIFGKGGSLFASHPPMEERIKRLKSAELTSVIIE